MVHQLYLGMRKITTLFAFTLTLALGLNAQTLTRAELFDVGTTQVYRKADTTGVTQGPAGTGQAWDFSTLVSGPAVVTNNYVLPSSHPSGSFFATANLTFAPANDAWQMFEASATDITIIGEKSTANTRLTYSDPATLFTFPVAFNTPNTDTVVGVYPDGFFSSVDRNGFYQVTFDADGSLITPFMTFPAAKRIEYIGVFRDSSWTGAATADNFLIRYEWYVPGRTAPVLILHKTQIILNGGNPQSSFDVWYADDNAVAIDAGMNESMVVAPNPTTGNTKLQLSLAQAEELNIEVLNVVGERVSLLQPGMTSAGAHSFELQTEGLAKGIYFVRVNRQGNSNVTKLVIQ